jgi:hypothetical protein
MATYRKYRNIEASLIDFITAQALSDSWSVRVEKSFSRISSGTFPVILVQLVSSPPNRYEIGSNKYLQYALINIRIFAENDGQRLDLASWLIDEFEGAIPYYEYEITNGVVSEKNQSGHIHIRRFLNNRKELELTEGLVTEDKYRHIISIEVKVKEA